ncbi:hypothetical protein QR680_004767 [Steinernema hermaphroditum]|uniref:Uncharacterized protein n=1 Tax=Steinernema hermaphroditum TaxID=289476 RepID=A0AA39LU76_9BILA|nr:hypothetical protein QR680_004767 [Steinernema hermaphroditum]
MNSAKSHVHANQRNSLTVGYGCDRRPTSTAGPAQPEKKARWPLATPANNALLKKRLERETPLTTTTGTENEMNASTQASPIQSAQTQRRDITLSEFHSSGFQPSPEDGKAAEFKRRAAEMRKKPPPPTIPQVRCRGRPRKDNRVPYQQSRCQTPRSNKWTRVAKCPTMEARQLKYGAQEQFSMAPSLDALDVQLGYTEERTKNKLRLVKPSIRESSHHPYHTTAGSVDETHRRTTSCQSPSEARAVKMANPNSDEENFGLLVGTRSRSPSVSSLNKLQRDQQTEENRRRKGALQSSLLKKAQKRCLLRSGAFPSCPPEYAKRNRSAGAFVWEYGRTLCKQCAFGVCACR